MKIAQSLRNGEIVKFKDFNRLGNGRGFWYPYPDIYGG